MKHVTYYLGAGASCNSLPLNKDLIKKIYEFYLNTYNNSGIELNKDKEFFAQKFKKIIDNSSTKKSIDTYAKMHRANDEELDDIKLVLWLYFSANSGHLTRDDRYDSLLLKYENTLLKEFNMADRVNFISWNYDTQLEESLADLYRTSIEDASRKFKSYPISHMMDQTYEEQDFRIVHLNGVSGYYYDADRSSYYFWRNKDTSSVYGANQIIEKFKEMNRNGGRKSQVSNIISFAWEKSDKSIRGIELSKKIAEKTTDLVIIGYSFPDYNMEIDSQIFKEMQKLERIFIQTLDKDEFEATKRKLIDHFAELKDVEIIYEHKILEFYKPAGI